MLTYDEKKKVKEVLSDGLGLNSNIRLAFYLDSINNTNETVQKLKLELSNVLHNQRVINDKLDRIIRSIK